MRALLEKALAVCDHAEVYVRDVYSTTVAVRLGKMQGVNANKKQEVALRMVKEGNMGFAVGSSLEDETVIERALISLKHQKSEAVPFSNAPIAEVVCASEAVQKLTTEDLVHMAFDLSDRLKRIAPDVSTGVTIQRELKEVSLANSSGFDGKYAYSNLSIALTTFTPQGFYGENKSYSGSDMPNITDADLEALIAFHRLGESPLSLENEKMPVIFSGSVMGALMLRVLGGVHGGNVLKEVSPLKDKIGTQIFSDKLTIRDDGTLAQGCNTVAFDDEGTPTQNTVLVEKGVLKSYLLGNAHAEKLGMSPTGNAFKRTLFSKEIEDVPAIFDTNLILEGDTIPDEDIIRSIKRGLFINGVMGAHTGNINQGEFSLNISSGFLIEDGVLKGKVKGAMIAGNIYELFKNVEAIGRKQEVMHSIFYEMGYSPMVLFSEANIVGK